MKAKCDLCGLRGHYDSNKVSEFYASRFKLIDIHKYKGFANPKNFKYICRNCIRHILKTVMLEQYQIEELHKPEVRER